MTEATFRTTEHDHDACVDTAMETAETICAERGARLTAIRRRVLEIIWGGHRPIGAYDVLDQLSTEEKRAAPPTVYRALDFLLEHGLVHRVASLNAYVGCAEPGHGGEGQFLICMKCGAAAELRDPPVNETIKAAASARGFVATSHTLEISGVCPNCA